jgi:hypothetical protein
VILNEIMSKFTYIDYLNVYFMWKLN